jgi:hypothetical protein
MDSQNADYMEVTSTHPKPLDNFRQPLDEMEPTSG